MLKFIQSILHSDLTEGCFETKGEQDQESSQKKLRENIINSNKEIDDERLNQLFLIPFKLERLVLIQCSLYLSSLIYNIVLLPVRVSLTAVHFLA